MHKKALLLVLLGLVVSVPAMAIGPTLDLAIDQYGTIPDMVIEVPTPVTLPFWAHLTWAGHEGRVFVIEKVSFHYVISGTGKPGKLVVTQIAQPKETYRVCEWFRWADVFTNQPPCTYICVRADIAVSIWPCHELVSNDLVFHLVPEPSSVLALLSGMVGLGGMVFFRRRR